jgi:hypothetical protein
MAKLRDRLPSGSYVVMSHVTLAEVDDEELLERAGEAEEEYNQQVTEQFANRDRAGFTALFDGFELVEPGVVYSLDWRPDGPVDAESPVHIFAAVGRKP